MEGSETECRFPLHVHFWREEESGAASGRRFREGVLGRGSHSLTAPAAALQRLTCGPSECAAGGPSTVDVRRAMHFTEVAPAPSRPTTSLQSTSPLRSSAPGFPSEMGVRLRQRARHSPIP